MGDVGSPSRHDALLLLPGMVHRRCRNERTRIGMIAVVQHIPGSARFSTICPRYMTAIRSASMETTARSWEMKR